MEVIKVWLFSMSTSRCFEAAIHLMINLGEMNVKIMMMIK